MQPPIEFFDDRDDQPVTAKASRWTLRRVIKWIGLVALLLLAGSYLLLVYRYYAHDVQIKRNYAAELNEPILRIPEEKRAWTHYRRALMVLEPLPSDLEGYGMIATSPNEENWPATVEYLRQNGKGLAMVRLAAAIRPLGELHRDEYDPADFPWLIRHGALTPAEIESPPTASENPPLLNLKRASSNCAMRLARLMAADARLAAMEGNSGRAVEDIFALCGMSEQWFEQTLLLDQLIGSEMFSIAIRTCGHILVDHPALLSDQHLSQLSNRLARSPQPGTMKIRFDGERMFFTDIVQRIYTDDGNGDGMLRPERMADFDEQVPGAGNLSKRTIKPWLPIAMRFIAGRRELLDAFEQYVSRTKDMAALPIWQRVSHDGEVWTAFEYSDVRHFLLALFRPTVEEYSRNAELLTQRRDALVAAIALVRWHRRHGQWPTSLNQLRPGLLDEMPMDRFANRPLSYRLIDGQPVVYSVGKNLTDDGGRPPARNDDSVAEWVPDPSLKGDLILWPSVEEPKQSTDDESPRADVHFPWPRPPEPEVEEVD